MKSFLATILVALIAACSDSGSGSGETGGCGDPGCACTEDAQCDAGLECHAAFGKCMAIDCDPGTLNCLCAMGQCATGLACMDEVCLDPGPTTSASVGEGTDTTAADSTTADATSSTTASTTATTSATTADSGESGPATTSESSESGVMPTCDDPPDCAFCLTCALDEGGACTDARADCSAYMECDDVAVCTLDCGANEAGNGCIDKCCGMNQAMGGPLYDDLAACLDTQCARFCVDFGC